MNNIKENITDLESLRKGKDCRYCKRYHSG